MPFDRFVREEGDCLVWTGHRMANGYGQYHVDGVPVLAHRYAWAMHNNAEIPKGMVICHTCDNPACVKPEHLWLGTQAENVRDMMAKGRQNHVPLYGPANGRYGKGECVSGERSGAAKLKDADVIEIRRLRDAGVPYREIRERFGISTAQVYRIAKHIQRKAPVGAAS